MMVTSFITMMAIISSLHHTPLIPTPAALKTQPLRTTLTLPPVPTKLKIPPALVLIPTHIPITPFLPTLTLSLRALTSHTPCNIHASLRHSFSRQQTVRLPSQSAQYYHQNNQPMAKIEPNKLINLFFYMIRKNIESAASSGEHCKSELFDKDKETSLLWQDKPQSMIIHKLQKRSRPTKLTKNSKDDHQQYQRLQPAGTTITTKDVNEQQHFILHRYICHRHKRNKYWEINTT